MVKITSICCTINYQELIFAIISFLIFIQWIGKLTRKLKTHICAQSQPT